MTAVSAKPPYLGWVGTFRRNVRGLSGADTSARRPCLTEALHNESRFMNYTKVIRDFVIANFLFGDAGGLKDDASFLDTGVVDSTGVLELITFLETTYGIKVEAEEMLPDNLDSVNKVVAYLMKKVAPLPEGPGRLVAVETIPAP
jgi:acyl carrier protein